MVRRAEEIALNRPPPSRGKAPSRIHRDWGPTVRSGFLSAESGANSVQVLPVSLLPVAGSVLRSRFSPRPVPGRDPHRTIALLRRGATPETGSGARSHVALLRTLAFRVGRGVRISFAPAASLRTTGPTRDRPHDRVAILARPDHRMARRQMWCLWVSATGRWYGY